MKKSILIIMPSMFIGGAEKSLIGLLESFDYDKYDVSLFLYRHEGEFLNQIPSKVKLLDKIEEYETFDVPIKSLFNIKQIRFAIARILSKVALKCHCLISKEKRGIWMSMQYTAKFLLPLLPNIPGKYDAGIMFLGISDILIKKVNCKVKVTWNHTDYDTLCPNKQMDLKTYKNVDYIVNVSDECTKKFIKYYPSLAKKALTIENILSKKLIIEQSKIRLNEIIFEKGFINLLSVGRFSHAKNFDNVPEICKIIRESGLNIKWYLIGYGGDEKLIKSKIKEMKMEEFVIILGKKSNPYPYIRACDVYVQPSRFEGKCVAVREAQILEKPVVITNYETSCSQLIDSYDGVIVPMNMKECAEGIIQLLNNSDKVHQLSKNCKNGDYTNSKEIEKIYKLLGD